MLNLLAVYYENIGPFKDTCCSLFFDEGKYLIKAPIGSGKSFLFFDAPRYALYKDSSRNMLNLQCKNGEISLIFECDGSFYLIKRILKTTKAGNDSCSSQLFSISYDGDNLLKDLIKINGDNKILQWGVNCISDFEGQNGKLRKIDEVSFKNETDLQFSLEALLPPKEVFLSTVFLLQDADNIFEMRPADRLIVLKNVFDLLGIDDAKEKIQDKKKEVGYKLKALQDHSLQDNKLRLNVRGLWDKINELETDDELNHIISINNSFFEDIEGFFDQLSINDFSLNGFDKSVFAEAENLVKNKVDEVVKLDAQLAEYQQQLSSINQQKSKISKDITETNNTILILNNKIENIDSKKGEELKMKKLELYHSGDSLNNNAKYSDFSEFVDFWNSSSLSDDSFEKLNMPNNLKDAYDILQISKDAGVKLKGLIEFERTKLENIDLQNKNWKENHDRELEKLKELKIRKEDEIKQQQLRIDELDKMWAETSDFDCPDLCKKCPHINAINKQQYDQYSKQKENLNHTLEDLKSSFNDYDFDNRINELENQMNPDGDDYKKDLELKIKSQAEFSDKLKEYLLNIGFSEREKSYKDYELIQKEIQSVDKQIFQWEEEGKNLEKYKQEKVAAETTIRHFEQTLSDYDKDTESINSKIELINDKKNKFDSDKLRLQQDNIKEIYQYIVSLEQLVEDNVNNKNLYNKLSDDEKKLTRLYSILSKDLVLFALDGYLPVLSDVINDYLSQCVDYTIKMQIVENNEKLELEAKIFDSKGEREVKSLSGGQRTVLKLVWMLAISSYLHTPLLFLDETINNLDADTVGKVSEMIDNFVKQRTMKFYTVTHNKEIQDMQIWDDIIEVNNVEKG